MYANNALQITKYVALVCVCLGGDKLDAVVQKSALLKAGVDNVTHALVGLIVADLLLRHFREQLRVEEFYALLAEAFVVSSLIDVDHFIEAGSISLRHATGLPNRPFLHNTTIGILLVVVTLCLQYNDKRHLYCAVAAAAFITHHLRDATRRGLWFRAPFLSISTPPVPYALYITLICSVPQTFAFILKRLQYSDVHRSRLVEIV